MTTCWALHENAPAHQTSDVPQRLRQDTAPPLRWVVEKMGVR